MNCGNSTHDNECLCDVVVPTPTGWINDAVQDMWLGDEIVAFKGYMQDGYTGEWNDEDILNYLQDLVYAKDNWERYKDTPRGIKENRTATTVQTRVREKLAEMNPPSIIKAIEDLGISYKTLMNALFQGKRDMPQETLEEFERDVLERNFSSPTIMGQKYGMEERSARKLHSYWNVPWGDQPTRVPASRKLMDKLLVEQPELTDMQISKIIKQQCGKYVSITRYVIRDRRLELQNNN